MAFRQPQRQLRIPPTGDEQQRGSSPESARQSLPPLADSQTRIIFSPTTDAATTTSGSYVAPTQKTASTPGRSRLSDLGSLRSAVLHSARDEDEGLSASYSEVLEDDGELDSLDSHLPEFRAGAPQGELVPFSHSNTVLPTHDGLGSFLLDHPAASTNVQEQLYAFEQFNPRRFRRRRESIELAQRELEIEEAKDADKMRRIEAWRLEQSKYLLQEIEKETRRRGIAGGVARSQSQAGRETDGESESRSTEWHEQDDPAGPGKKETTWAQTIKSVIKEIVGIEEKLLSVLFGDGLPTEDDLSSTPKASEFNSSRAAVTTAVSRQGQNWQDRVLARIARELGLLVHRLSDHPGAFSTYVRMQQMPLPYAGLPVIPETTNSEPRGGSERSATSIQFQPTIKQATQPIDIPSVKHPSAPASDAAQAGNDEYGATFTQQEWEQELDVKMVFRYLRSRFSSRPAASSPPIISTTATSAAHFGLTNAQETAAKAARVRLHHPLVSRSRPIERRTFKATVPPSPAALRHASSCASQSTRKSARRGSGSSRHYWDIGSSVGTGSIIASAGPMGSWGDV